MKYLQLVRYQNLLLVALMQLIFRFGFLKLQNIPVALTDWQYGLLVLATVFIAAGGYIINDIFDQETDSDNKLEKVIIGKSISESKAYNGYFVMTVLGVGIGFYLSNVIQKPGFAAIFIVIAATLYLYASSLKQMLVIGNLTVAFLLSFSVIIIGIFDLFPVTYEGNQPVMSLFFKLLFDYAVFAFIINFIREIIKDMEDVNGDYNQGMSTLPIVLGVKRTGKIVFGLLLISIVILMWYLNSNLMESNLFFASIYCLLLVIGPLLFCLVKMWSAKSKKEFHLISSILKFVILFGILSILIINLNIKYNA